MRTALTVLIFAAGIGLSSAGSAGAVPAGGAAIKDAAMAASAVQQAQFSIRRTRHGYRKCYREFVIGRYVCRTYR